TLDSNGVDVSQEEINSGRLQSGHLGALVRLARQSRPSRSRGSDGRADEHSTQSTAAARAAGAVVDDSGNDVNDDGRWPIKVTILRDVDRPEVGHGRRSELKTRRVAPVMLLADLRQDGSLAPVPQPQRQVSFPRDLLEPSQGEVAIATVDQAD